MRKFKIAAAIVVPLALIIFCLGLWAGHRLFSPPAVKAGPTAVLAALHDRGFLVSTTYVFDQPVTISHSTGSAFKDFFFGQTITGRGAMEVNLGIDLGKVAAEDVTVDGDTLTVHLPKVSLFNSRLIGPVELKNDKGLLKRLLDSDDGYNEVLSELSKQAELAAQNPELLDRAGERAREDAARILGYVAPGKKITVSFK